MLHLLSLTGLNFVQSLGQPIQERYLESEERPKAFEEMGKQIQQYMKIVEAYKTKVQLKGVVVVEQSAPFKRSPDDNC